MTATQTNVLAPEMIRSIVERVERLHEERTALGSEISDIFKEGKSNGLDVRALKEVIRLRRIDRGERQERETMVDLYMQAVGEMG